MNRNGFTLVELLIVTVIIGILLAISTIAFSNWVRRNQVESQFKTMYADLMTARSQALYNKNGTGKLVSITGTVFTVYATNVNTTPVLTKVLKVPLTPADTQIVFDTSGVAATLTSGGVAVTEAYVCVQTNDTSAVFNSLIISKTRIQMATLSGGVCSNANVTPQ